jgi:hypothetical protein
MILVPGPYEYDSPGCTSIRSNENIGSVIAGKTRHAMRRQAIDIIGFA